VVDSYAPVVYHFARKQGLQDADAADLTQDVLRAVAGAVPRLDYDPQRGSFRGWLFTVVRNKFRTHLSRRQHQQPGSGDSDVQRFLEAQPAPPEEDRLWDEEYQRRLFTWAADRVKIGCQESTWSAFWMTAVQGHSGKEAAEVLGMTVAAVYLAKRRVMSRLQEEIQCLRDA